MTGKIIYRNLVHKPLNALLSIGLLMLSVAIISLLLVVGKQVNRKLDNDLRDIDMVIGAKGSPLQLVLSAVYHVDAPTGNIRYAEAQKALAGNPMVESAIPLAYGDSYKGYRILGTDTAFIGKYEGALATGRLFEKPMEVVLGAQVARLTGLKVGDSFHGTHGEDARGKQHDDHDYTVTGILQPSQTVLDQLVITSMESVWDIHADHDHEAEGGGHEHSEEEQDITAMLVKFRSPMATLTMPRIINQQTSLQAAVPTLEINRLLSLMGIGISTLQGIALAIMLIAGLSVFVSLYNRLRERRYEQALMRSMGASRGKLFALVLAEGIVLALVGFALGIALCRLGLWLLNRFSAGNFHFRFDYGITPEEGWLLLVTLLIGIFAALIPAIRAFRLNIAQTLSDG